MFKTDIRNPLRYLLITLLLLSWHLGMRSLIAPAHHHMSDIISFCRSAILTECFCVIGEFEKLSYNRAKNPATQDSPPAAGRMSDIIPFCRSAILTECFCVIGEFRELPYNTKKISEKRILINTFSEISYSPAVFSAFFSKYNTSQFSIPCPTCINYFASAQKFSWTKPGAGNCEYNHRNGYTPYCWDSSTRQDPSCRLSDIFRRRCTGSRRSDIDRRQSDERGRRSRPVDTDIYKTDDKLSRTVQPVPRV